MFHLTRPATKALPQQRWRLKFQPTLLTSMMFSLPSMAFGVNFLRITTYIPIKHSSRPQKAGSIGVPSSFLLPFTNPVVCKRCSSFPGTFCGYSGRLLWRVKNWWHFVYRHFSASSSKDQREICFLLTTMVQKGPVTGYIFLSRFSTTFHHPDSIGLRYTRVREREV